jgi:hypothetical protein
MKKIVFIPLTIVILYCIIWFGTASFIEYKIKSVIAGASNDKFQVVGDYEVNVSGFPFDFSLKLSKPHFRFIDNNQNIQSTYDLIFNGDFKLSTSWLVKSIELVSNGGITIKGVINGYNFNVNADAAQDTVYQINLYDTPLWGEGLKKVLGLGEHPEDIIKLIKKVKVETSGCSIKTVGSNQSLFSADKIQLKLAPDFRDPANKQLSLQQDIVNANFTNAALTLWQHLNQIPTINNLLHTINPEVRNYFSVLTLPKLGNMNYSADIDYKGDTSSSFDLTINKLNLQDNLINIAVKGDASSNINNLSLDLKSDSRFSEAWYQLMRVYAQTLKPNKVSSGSSHNSSIFKSIFDSLKSQFSTNSSLVYAAYVPRLQDFGQIHNQIKLNIKSSDNKQNYDITVKNLTFEVEPYSLAVSGNLQQKQNQQAYDGKLALNGYGLIVNDLFGYSKRITSALGRKFFIGNLGVNLTEQTRFEIQSFIKQISDEPNANSINITLSAHKGFNETYPAVGRYSSQEFGMLWNKLIATIVIGESLDKLNQIQKILPSEIQGNVGEQIEKKLAPLQDLLSNF